MRVSVIDSTPQLVIKSREQQRCFSGKTRETVLGKTLYLKTHKGHLRKKYLAKNIYPHFLAR